MVSSKYVRKRVRPVKFFDKRSFRTVDVGRPGHHKIIIGCQKGKYDKKKKMCKVGTKVQAILEER